MSISAIQTVASTTYGGRTYKAIMFAIANRVSKETGRAYPSVRTIAEDAECDERTVRRSLRYLEQAGFLKVTHRVGRSSWYSIPAPSTERLPTKVQRCGTSAAVDNPKRTPDTVPAPPDTGAPPPRTSCPPILVSNLLNKPSEGRTGNNPLENLESKGREVGFRMRRTSETFECYRAEMDRYLKSRPTGLASILDRLPQWKAAAAALAAQTREGRAGS